MISTGKNTFEVENMDHSGWLSSVSATNQHLLKQGLSSAVTPRLTQYTGHPAKGSDHETAQNRSPASTGPERTQRPSDYVERVEMTLISSLLSTSFYLMLINTISIRRMRETVKQDFPLSKCKEQP